MSTLTVTDLRARIATGLAAMSGWRESRWAYDALPVIDQGSYEHKVFAVGTLSTVWDSPVESSPRKRSADGGLVETMIGVRCLFRLRADGQVFDYAAALTDEAVVYKALIGLSDANVHLSLSTMTRRGVGDGTWLLGEIQAVARHRLPLS